jgi:hypothetical protein
MTKTWYNLWPKKFVIQWIQIHDDTKFVTDWRHIYDLKTNFVTDEQMWRHHSDQTKNVTKTSQKTNCDHSGVFNDDNATSLMTTSLLVLPPRIARAIEMCSQTKGIHPFHSSIEQLTRWWSLTVPMSRFSQFTNRIGVSLWRKWVPTLIQLVRNRMPVSLRGGGGELGNLKP